MEPNKAGEADESQYDEKTEQAYMYLRANGRFEDNVMPLIPPKMEWCTWDF
jgi:nucleoporin NUP42